MRPIPSTPPSILAGALLLALSAAPVHGQDGPGGLVEDRSIFWEMGLVGGIVDDRPEFGFTAERASLAHEGLVGGRIAAHLPSRFFLESELIYTPMELVSNDGSGARIQRLDGLMALVGAGYVIPLSPSMGMHLRSGLGAVRWDPGSGSEVDFIFNAGTGLRLRISPHLGLRSDARWHLAPSAFATIRRDLTDGSDARGEPLWLGELSAGLSLYLGR
jgi:hypothetical protein